MLSRLRRLIGASSAALILSYPLLCQTFAPPTHYGPSTQISQLKAGDFNRDGAADLVGVAPFNNGTQTQVMVYMNNGSGGFSAPTVIAGTVGASTVAIGDFNQDGNLDVVFLTNQVGIAYGNGNGTFRAPVFHTVDGAPDSIAIGDYNHDGKPDVATLSNGTKKVTVLLNNGGGYFYYTYSFAIPLYYSTTNSGYSPDTVSNLVSGDFNGNHQTDLAYISQCNDVSCGPGLARIYTLMNAYSKWTPNLVPDQLSGFGELAVADVDLDGKVDLLVSSSGSGGGAGNFGQVFVEYSNGNGSFTRVFLDDSNGSSGIPRSLAVGDFNDDGIEDVAGYTNTDLYGNFDYGFDVYTGKGGRSGFNGPFHFADRTYVYASAAAFIDQNGTRDISLVDQNGLAVYLNTTSQANNPCPFPTGNFTGFHICSPVMGGSGSSPVHTMVAYKSPVQAALRIEIWVDGHKAFQEYGDYLNANVWMATGTHQLAVVGVDATGQYITRKFTYTVK